MRGDMKTKRILASLLSILIPGAGQMLLKRFTRGVAILLSVLALIAMVAIYQHPAWYILPALVWLWNIWDCLSLTWRDRAITALIPLAVSLLGAYAIGWQVVGIDFSHADMKRALAILRPMANPDFIQPRQESNIAWVEIQIPCLANPPSGENTLGSVNVKVVPSCQGVGDPVVATATGLWPNTDTNIWWEDPNGQEKMVGVNEAAMLVVHSDANGNVTASFNVPSTALVAVPDVNLSPPQRIYFGQYRPLGGIEFSFVGGQVLKGARDTIGMALMATLLATIFAVPISFLAARNLMSGNPITFGIYVVTRTILNILRSIESLIVAIVFVVIVGLGPFPGMLALAVHSIAALAKLYSEVIEGIDLGPIEAVRATGANWLQVVRYAVIPQIIPPFTAFTIYRWDINVRSATIVGFVGGGGLGFLLIELIRINDMRGVSSVFISIAVIVIAMDYLSAKIRERLV